MGLDTESYDIMTALLQDHLAILYSKQDEMKEQWKIAERRRKEAELEQEDAQRELESIDEVMKYVAKRIADCKGVLSDINEAA